MGAGLDNLLELGFGVAVGIVCAAFLMAPVLIPSLSTIEGHRFWWPRHARPGRPPEPEPGLSPRQNPRCPRQWARRHAGAESPSPSQNPLAAAASSDVALVPALSHKRSGTRSDAA